MQQGARNRMMDKFRKDALKILVATDVIGRGIDVSGVSHIINYDIPEFSDDYVHRVGRTGRMGREGVAFTFVSPEEGPQLTRIEMRIDKLLKRAQIEGWQEEPEVPEEETPKDPEKEPPKPLYGNRGRRRHRRAL